MACAASVIDGRQPDEPGWGRTIERLELLGPTIFPIVFGAAIGRFIQFFAVWKASAGSQLGVGYSQILRTGKWLISHEQILEQLVGSRTLFLAVERSFLVRTRSFYTLVVPLLWGLSPLGGQSSLRILSRTETDIQSPTTLTYYNDTYWSGNVYDSSSNIINSRLPDNIYAACLLQSNQTRVSSLDSWGNLKIPRLKSLKAFSSSLPADQWTDVFSNDTTYSSLVGLMLELPPRATGTTIRFPIEATYLDVNCADKFSTTSYPELIGHLGPITVGFNSSKSSNSSDGTPLFFLGQGQYSALGFNNFVLGVPTKSPQALKIPEHLSLKFAAKAYSQNSLLNQFFSYDCVMTMPRVEAEVTCKDILPCYVSRMRTSQRSTVSFNTTPFNDEQAIGYVVAGTALQNFLGHFLWASGTARIFQRTASEWYMLTGQTNLGGNGDGTEYATLAEEQLSSRMSTLLSTLWKIAVAGEYIYNHTVAENSTCVTNFTIACRQSGYYPAQAEASLVTSVQTWKANKAWIGITMAVSIIAFAFGILGLLFKRLVKAPDILGYVSTMTRDNLHFEGPGGGERLDGVERARLLRGEDVKLMMVSDTSNHVGHMALASDRKNGKYEPIVPAQTARNSTGDGTDHEIIAPESRDHSIPDAISSIATAQSVEENYIDGGDDTDSEVSVLEPQPQLEPETISPTHT